MPSIDWVPVAASSVLIGTGLMFVVSPAWALTLLDFARLVLGDRDMAQWYRHDPPKVTGSFVPDVVSTSPGFKRGYRIGGAVMTFLGALLLFRALNASGL